MTNDEILIAVARYKLLPKGEREKIFERVEYASKYEQHRELRNNAVNLLKAFEIAERELKEQFEQLEKRITNAIIQRLNIGPQQIQQEHQNQVASYPLNYGNILKPVFSTACVLATVYMLYLIGVGVLIGVAFFWFMISALMKNEKHKSKNEINDPDDRAGTVVNNFHFENVTGNITINQTNIFK